MLISRGSITSAGLAAGAVLFGLIQPAAAQVKIVLDFALTGPTAAVIVAHDKTWKVLPRTLGGQPAVYQVVDDHGDPTEAVKLVRRAISEENVDAIVMAGTIPICDAVSQIALDTEDAGHLHVTGRRVGTAVSLAVYGCSENYRPDAAGGCCNESTWVKDDRLYRLHRQFRRHPSRCTSEIGDEAGIKVATDERFDRTATSLTGQALKVLAANPDAVFVGASGTPAALAQKTLVDLGYKGPIYLTNAVFSADFIRIGGKSVQGGIALASPFFLADQLPELNPNKPVALGACKNFGDRNTATTNRARSAGFGYDAYLMLDRATAVAALKANPGPPEFRIALRDAMEEISGPHRQQRDIHDDPTDHNGTTRKACCWRNCRTANGYTCPSRVFKWDRDPTRPKAGHHRSAA